MSDTMTVEEYRTMQRQRKAARREMRARNPQLTDRDMRELSGAEDVADLLLDQMRLHAPDLAPRFVRDLPFSRFKIDLAVEAARLAVEVNGGLMRAGGGKHATARDHQKVRQMVIAGWRVLIFTASEVRADPMGCIADIRKALEAV